MGVVDSGGAGVLVAGGTVAAAGGGSVVSGGVRPGDAVGPGVVVGTPRDGVVVGAPGAPVDGAVGAAAPDG
ncbi:MAG TPA: hypothetical protein VIG50_21105, partial [Vicinamibacteria bacterium]